MGKQYKKFIVQFLVITFFIFFVMNGTAAAIPSILHVGGEGNGNYTTIQAAVNNASSGDTILVYPGTYVENVNANVDNISIRSFSGNPEDTIVKRFGLLSHNFRITANNVTISGFNITGINSTGIYISGVSGANITNNKLSGVGCGVQIESASRCSFINNTINNSADKGFYLISSNNCTLANNTISNTIYECILLDRSDNITLANNTVSYPGSYGVRISSSNYCTMINNTVSYTDADGIYLSSSSYCTLANNTVSDTDSYGICLSSSNYCTLTGNRVSNVYYEGIRLYYSSNCNLTGNKVSNTYDNSIFVYYSENCTLTGNIVSDSYYRGISLYEAGSCNIANNTVSNINSEGIFLIDSNSCILTSNVITDAYGGIHLDYSNECVLRNNTASSGVYGISLSDSGNCTFTGNIMSGNWYNFDLDLYDLEEGAGNIIDTSNLVDGKAIYYFEREPNPSIGSNAGVVYCINSGKVEIKDLVLQNNSFAIFLYNTSSEIRNNTVNNTMYGITAFSSQDVRLSNSRIENSAAGIVFEDSKNVTVTNNNVRNSIFGVVTFGSENCTLKSNSIQESTENYRFLASGNTKLVRDGKDAPIYENSFINSNLVQVARPYGFGIYSINSRDLKLENNTVNQTGAVGIYLLVSEDVKVLRNSVRNIGYMGIYSEDSSGVELLDNTVLNITGEFMLPKAANLPFVSSSLVSKSIEPSGYGIFFDSSENIRLKGNTIKDCYSLWGIYLYEPVNATLEGNTIQNCQGGIVTVLSENFSVNDCSVNNCTFGGILVINPEEEIGNGYTVSGCNVEGSNIGVLVTGEGTLVGNALCGNSYGLILYDVNNSLIHSNTMTQNSLAGLAIDLEDSEIMSHSGLVRGMESPESGNNTIYNNYFNNANNTLINTELNNTWNISKTVGKSIVGGPYLGGNYWANPDGTGFSENCTDTDRDGIADSFYEIANGTFDYLPLKIIPSEAPRRGSSSANYVPSNKGSTGVTGIDSAQKRVVAGTMSSFKFNNPVSGILGLSFTPKLYSGNVVVRIEVLGDKYSGKIPEGEVYQLMNILVGNDKFENESNIKGASINFRVSKSWVKENSIDVSTIAMSRFHDKKWTALPTEMTGEDKEYYYFRTETPGFSLYAITGNKLGIGNTQGMELITPTEKETGTVTGDEQTNDKKTPGFESTFTVFGILASVFFAKKRFRNI